VDDGSTCDGNIIAWSDIHSTLQHLLRDASKDALVSRRVEPGTPAGTFLCETVPNTDLHHNHYFPGTGPLGSLSLLNSISLPGTNNYTLYETIP